MCTDWIKVYLNEAGEKQGTRPSAVFTVATIDLSGKKNAPDSFIRGVAGRG